MKITSTRGYLSAAVTQASKAVGRHTRLPIINSVLFQTGPDRLTVTATDFDTAIHSTIPCTVHTEGAVCIPAAPLRELLTKLPDANVTIEALDGRVEIKSSGYEYELLTLAAEDFPIIPDPETIYSFTIPQSRLKGLLGLTVFAACKEESRSILMGALFEVTDGKVAICATDTHRLARVCGEITGGPVMGEIEDMRRMIIPAKFLTVLGKFLRAGNDEPIEVQMSASNVKFVTPDVTFLSCTIEGSFPNYGKVIPTKPERFITFDRTALLSTLKRVNIVSKHNSQKVLFATNGKSAGISARSQDVGKALENIGADIKGEPLNIAFDTGYLVQVLGLCGGERVTLSLNGARNPGLLRVEGNPDFLYVVMPMEV